MVLPGGAISQATSGEIMLKPSIRVGAASICAMSPGFTSSNKRCPRDTALRRARLSIIACLYDCAYNSLRFLATGTVKHGTEFRGAAQGIPRTAAKDLS